MSDSPKPAVSIFDASAIAVATFLGSPLAGAALWAVNEMRVGRGGRALVALATGIGITAALLAVGFLGLPSSVSIGLTIGATMGARAAAQVWESQLRAENRFEITHAPMIVAVGAGALGCLGVLALAFAAMDVGEGDACEGNVASCIDGTSALWCDGGAYHRVGCGGEGGCDERDGRVLCSRRVGDACVGDADECAGAHTWARCVNGVMVERYACRGPAGCRIEEDERLHCDQSIAAVGDRCDNGHSCSEDGRYRLACEGGVNVADLRCPEGCRIEGEEVVCDDGVPAAGAP